MTVSSGVRVGNRGILAGCRRPWLLAASLPVLRSGAIRGRMAGRVPGKTMKTERVNGHRVRCYDNGGFDRFTAVYLDRPEGPGTFQALGASERPFHPQGFGQHCAAALGRHLGRRVAFSDLPADVQRAILRDCPKP